MPIIPPKQTPPKEDHHHEKDPEQDTIRPTKYLDDALADVFSTRHAKDCRYVDEWGWLQWTGTRWQRVSDAVVMGYARHICRQQSELCQNHPEINSKAALARPLASAKTVAAV
jgi:hypothetical protein